MAKLTAKELNATSIQIAKTATELGKAIHMHCLHLMAHIQNNGNGDVTVAEIFVRHLSKVDKNGKRASIVRSEAVQRWLKDFAFVKFSDAKPATLDKKRFNAAKATGFKEHNAKARVMAWNRYVPEPGMINSEFDINAAMISAINSLVERREKVIKAEGQYERQTAEARAKNIVDSEAFQKLLSFKADIETANAAAA